MQLFFARQPGQLFRSKNKIDQVNPLINLAHRSLFFATFLWNGDSELAKIKLTALPKLHS